MMNDLGCKSVLFGLSWDALSLLDTSIIHQGSRAEMAINDGVQVLPSLVCGLDRPIKQLLLLQHGNEQRHGRRCNHVAADV